MRIKLLTRGTPYTPSYHFASLALHKFLLQNNILINIFGPGRVMAQKFKTVVNPNWVRSPKKSYPPRLDQFTANSTPNRSESGRIPFELDPIAIPKFPWSMSPE